MKRTVIALVLMLVSLSLVYAHEGHVDENEPYWTWDDDIENGDFYTWEMTVNDNGNQRSGVIEIEIIESLSEQNIMEKIEENPGFLGSSPGMVVDPESTVFSDFITYTAVHFVLPVQFDYNNGTKGNYFDLGLYSVDPIPMIYFSLGIVNDYTDLEFTVDGDIVTIEGKFAAIGSDDTGVFEVIYEKNGLLSYFEWGSDAENPVHIIERQRSIAEAISIPTLPVILAIILVPIVTHYLVQIREE